jgi:hypothetical protein
MGSLTYQAAGIRLAFRFLENRFTPSAKHARLSEQKSKHRDTQTSWLYLLILLLNLPLYGIDRDRRLDQLYHTAWTFKEGAPGEVHALALANKMARMAWVVLYKGEAYRPPSLPQVIAA